MTASVVNGLAPSVSLAPSAGLAPRATVYAGGPVTPHRIAMGVGAGGALVDVSPWVEYGEGVAWSWGRESQWDDTAPGTFGFTLNNADGRFTPGNAASPLATTVVEGMAVVWQIGARLVQTAVLAIEFGTSEDAWDLLKITCDDQLGSAGRHDLTALADGLSLNGSQQLMWRLDEEDQGRAPEANGSSLGAFALSRSGSVSSEDAVAFGVEQVDGLPGTALTLTAQPGEVVTFGTARGNTVTPVPPIEYAAAMPAAGQGAEYFLGWWNQWIYPGSTISLAVTYRFATVGGRWPIVLAATPTGLTIAAGTYPVQQVYRWTAAQMLAPQWVSLRVRRIYTAGQWWVTATAWVADVQAGPEVYYNDPQGNDSRVWDLTTDPQPVQVELAVDNTGGSAPLSGTVQRVSLTLNGTGNEKDALLTTEDQRRRTLDYISGEITSGTYPGTTLSSAPIGHPDVSGRSVLDVFNDIVRTEQGHLFTATSGTLTAPTSVIQFRGRDRPTVVKASFDVVTECDGLPTFLRDITNLAATIDVAGPASTVTVTDSSVTPVTTRYLANGLSETILNRDDLDLRMWGQDRLRRGKNSAVRTESFTIDLTTTPTDRSGDVLGLVPGDRVRLTGLPATRLGMTSWDGWVLGFTEDHGPDHSQVTVFVQPCLPNPITADVGNLIGNGGELALGLAVSATDTTMILAGVGVTLLSDVVPYTVRLGADEHVTITSVGGDGLTAQVTRGADGTTAKAWPVGSTIGVLTPTTLGF